jgi:hypothetical protein
MTAIRTTEAVLSKATEYPHCVLLVSNPAPSVPNVIVISQAQSQLAQHAYEEGPRIGRWLSSGL